jgi:hypothetical protein
MKRLLFWGWASAGALVGCAKTESAAPASLEGTWDFAAGSTVTAPKNGDPSVTAPIPYTAGGMAVPGGLTIVYGPNGVFTSYTATSTGHSTYTYSGNTITTPTNRPNGQTVAIITVQELTAHKLVTVEQYEDARNVNTLHFTFVR